MQISLFGPIITVIVTAFAIYYLFRLLIATDKVLVVRPPVKSDQENP